MNTDKKKITNFYNTISNLVAVQPAAQAQTVRRAVATVTSHCCWRRSPRWAWPLRVRLNLDRLVGQVYPGINLLLLLLY